MKRYLLILLLISCKALYAQSTMDIYFNNGSKIQYQINDIDTITYKSVNCPTTVTDVEGNMYNTIQIGYQCWMKENLKTGHYQNGAPILTGLASNVWMLTNPGACEDYNFDSTISNIYGKLYNFPAIVNAAGLCPVGWHIPSKSEWNVLIKTVDSNADTSLVLNTNQGGAYKEIGTTYWLSPNTGATNTTGFSALPGGYRDEYGDFQNLTYTSQWWSTSIQYNLYYYDGVSVKLSWNNSLIKNYLASLSAGLSVRCVKD
ncbi:MAG: hypothetical protein RL516_462 [Bacteroidota bacterium]|jgi:uncharacterized protein (TIGR02145 family)